MAGPQFRLNTAPPRGVATIAFVAVVSALLGLGVDDSASGATYRGESQAAGGQSSDSFAPATSEPLWSSPQPLSGTGLGALDAQVAAGGNGDAVVVWKLRNRDGGQIQASSRVDGGAWSAPVDVDASSRGGEPQVATNGDDSVVVWRAGRRIMASRQSLGGAWTAPVPLSARRVRAASPQVAMDDRGDVTVVWMSSRRIGTRHRDCPPPGWRALESRDQVGPAP